MTNAVVNRLGLNDQQQKAVDLEANKILCLAGAGTGKTFCMVSRLTRIVNSGIDPSSILVLTFTNAAAFEMKERYMRQNTGPKYPEFRTFHSFCYSLISKDLEVRKKLGYFKIPKIASNEESRKLSMQAKMQCGIKISDKKLNGGSKVLDMKDEQAIKIYSKCLYRLYHAANLITFDQLCYKVCELFNSDDPTVLQYKDQYKYIFVDEFQDTDPRQYEFISSFKDSKLFVVGDALQSIYSFRGADSSIIMSLAEDKEWSTVKLYQNYRSTRSICEYANVNSKYADPSYRIAINSDKDNILDSGDVEEYMSHEYDFDKIINLDEISAVVKDIQSGTRDGNYAVLARTNSEVELSVNYLRSKGICCSTNHDNSDCINILRSVTDDSYMINWLSTFLDSNRFSEYIRNVAIESEERTPKEVFIHYYGSTYEISKRLIAVSEVRKIFLRRDKSSKLSRMVDILNTLGVKLEEPLDDSECCTVKDCCEYLISMINNQKKSEVYVGTIHSSKGLEFDNVYLLGVGSRKFRLSNEENFNLFYVGITRAKKHLKVFRCYEKED